MLVQTSPMQRFDQTHLSLTVEGTSPQRFYPTYIDFGGMHCYEQQA